MKKATLSLVFAVMALPAFCTIWVITSPDFNFSPPTITIQEGDSVRFAIGNNHNAVEVSMAAWNNNQNTPLAGGFAVPFGGGMVLPHQLEAGTHFYVCQPHVQMGMKGTIIVEAATATKFDPYNPSIAIYPNPSSGNVQFFVNMPDKAGNYNIHVYNLEGEEVYATTQSAEEFTTNVDLGFLPKGVYIVRFNEKTGTYSKRLILQ